LETAIPDIRKGALQGGDIEFLHLQHGFEGASDLLASLPMNLGIHEARRAGLP
jgi:hypothetical protein